jgi:hypothetical protein
MENTNLKSVNLYEKCDPFYGTNNVEFYGYHRDTTLGEMVDKAIAYNCNIIQKNGKKGKWYLKGQGKEYDVSKEEIEKKVGNNKYKMVWLIKF